MTLKRKSIEQDFNKIIDSLYQEFQSGRKEEPFLLFDMAHAKENDHTRFLKRLLSYQKDNKYIFLESFCNEVLGINSISNIEQATISEQQKAVGNNENSSGYIDLYIKVGDINIIVENKICGAADCTNQLNRYVFSVNHQESADWDEFNRWNYKLCRKNPIPYVVYLTKNGEKEPDESSLNSRLRYELEKLYRFKQVNYQDDILPWLEKLAIPHNDTNLYTGIKQYIAYLEYFLNLDKDEIWLKQENFEIKNEELIENLTGWLKATHEDKSQSFINQVERFRASLIENTIPSDSEWVLHFGNGIICLSKKNWIEQEERKYSNPSVAFCSTYQGDFDIHSGWEQLKWQFTIKHLNKGKGTFQKKVLDELCKSLAKCGFKYQVKYANKRDNADFLEKKISGGKDLESTIDILSAQGISIKVEEIVNNNRKISQESLPR